MKPETQMDGPQPAEEPLTTEELFEQIDARRMLLMETIANAQKRIARDRDVIREMRAKLAKLPRPPIQRAKKAK